MTTDENAPIEGTKAADAVGPSDEAAITPPGRPGVASAGAHSVDRLAHGYQPLTRREARTIDEERRTGAIPVQPTVSSGPTTRVSPIALSGSADPSAQSLGGGAEAPHAFVDANANSPALVDPFGRLGGVSAEQAAPLSAPLSSEHGWDHLESLADQADGWESTNPTISKGERFPRRRRRWLGLVIAVVVLALVAGGGYFAWKVFAPKIGSIAQAVGPDDYTGEGSGSVEVTIKEGATGADVANALYAAGVVKTSNTFYQLILGMSPAPVFYPGVYRLHKYMSAKDALALLQNPSSSVGKSLVVPEGETQKNIVATAVKDGISAGDMQNAINAAVASPAAFGLPAGLAPFLAQTKNLEGFLFPATYVITPGMTANQLVTQMTQRAMQAFAADGVDTDAQTLWNQVTLASIVEKEAGSNPNDAAKIARVFDNRLAQGMPLQSDATVAYGAGISGQVFTTNAEREDASNPYNTYAHTGLPIGPISNPGDAALKAALHPTPGSWLYFVVVNLQTGETVFSDTYAGQQAADAQLSAWCAASEANKKLCQ